MYENNNNFNFQIEKVSIDPQGRFIICDIKTNETCLTWANVYAPNEDNPAFFLDLFDHLTDFKAGVNMNMSDEHRDSRLT